MMVAQVTGLQARRVHPHASATRTSISITSSRRGCSLSRAPRRAADDAAQPGGEGHLRLPLRGFRARRLRAASAHQGRGGGVSAARAAFDRHRACRRGRRQRRDRPRQCAAVAAELRSQALQGADHGQAGASWAARPICRSAGRLPGRTNIVVSRDPGFAAPGVLVAGGLEPALAAARGDALRRGADEIAVIGGTDIYAQSHAPCRSPGDHPCACAAGGRYVLSADRSRCAWREVARSEHPAGPQDERQLQLRHLRPGVSP